MPVDIFNREAQELAGVYAPDQAKLILASEGEGEFAKGLIVQNFNWSYAQPSNRIFAYGQTATYLVSGRPQGAFGLSSIVGPAPLRRSFLTKYGDICRARRNMVTVAMAAGLCNEDARVEEERYRFMYCWITNVAMQGSVQDNMHNVQLQLAFIHVEHAAGGI